MATPNTDPLARRIKHLGSEARKLRGWVASDPGKNDPLVDALNELTALRLLGHGWQECFADAQEALTRSAQLVAYHGSVGPFTPLDDAVRFFTATTHVAWAQAGAGQVAAAAQTVAALRAWRGLIPHLSIAHDLLPRTAVWFLLASARAALGSGDVAAANAAADAALARAREAEPDAIEGSVVLDALCQVADARWAARRPEDALSAGADAVSVAWQGFLPLVAPQARVTPAWAARVIEPLAAAIAVQATRLWATGSQAAATALRQDFVRQVSPRLTLLGDPAREACAWILTDQATDERLAGHPDAALDAAGRAAELVGVLVASEPQPGARLGLQIVVVAELAQGLAAVGEADEAREALASLASRVDALRRPAGHETALILVQAARNSLETPPRPTPEEAAARAQVRGWITPVEEWVTGWAPLNDDALARIAPIVEPDQGTPTAAQRDDALREPVRTPSLDLPSPMPIPEPEPAATEPEVPELPGWQPAREPEQVTPRPTPEPVEPEPVESEPMQPEPSRWQPAPEAAPVPTPEPDSTSLPVPEPERVTPESAPEPAPEPEEAAPTPDGGADLATALPPAFETLIEPGTATEPEAAPAAAEPSVPTAPPGPLVAQERSRYEVARGSGDRSEALAAANAWVEAARAAFGVDERGAGPDLIAALRALGDARFRSGDWWGSRQPNKEAKALSRRLGL